MALLDQNRTYSQSAVLSDMLSRAAYGLVLSVIAWNDARRTRNSLLSLTTQELDDIGLCRGDVDDIVRRVRY